MWTLVEILWIYSRSLWLVGEPRRLISTCSCLLSYKCLSGCGSVLVALHAHGNSLEVDCRVVSVLVHGVVEC